MSTIAIALVGVAILAVVGFVVLSRARETSLEAPPRSFSATPAQAPKTPAPAATAPPTQDPRAQRLQAAIERLTLPALALEPDEAAPREAGGTRLGGPVWLPDGAAWPQSRLGAPLEFLAQLDFTRLPALDGFPREGLLQFFVARGAAYGFDADDPARADFAVLWHPALAGGSLRSPPALSAAEAKAFRQVTPVETPEIRERGVPLRPSPMTSRPDLDNPVLDEALEIGDEDDIPDWADEFWLDPPFCHQTGGYPVTSPDEVPAGMKVADYDTLLLRLTSDDLIAWDEVGEANFLIRRADLAKRDFSRVLYYWE